jgi:putative oxidoreductase
MPPPEEFSMLQSPAAARGQVGPLSGISASAAAASLAGRVFLSAIFILSGISKLAAPVATIGYIQSAGLPFAPVGFAIAATIEILGGVALIVGYRTRVVAMVLAAFTAAAALAFHSRFGDHNQFVHFFKNIAMTGGLLQVVAFGAGSFSIDARWRRP